MHWRIFWGRERPWWVDHYGWNKNERSEHFDEFFFWLGRFSFDSDKRLEGSFRLEALKILWWDKYWLNLMGVMTRQCGRVVFLGFFQCESLFLSADGSWFFSQNNLGGMIVSRAGRRRVLYEGFVADPLLAQKRSQLFCPKFQDRLPSKTGAKVAETARSGLVFEIPPKIPRTIRCLPTSSHSYFLLIWLALQNFLVWRKPHTLVVDNSSKRAFTNRESGLSVCLPVRSFFFKYYLRLLFQVGTQHATDAPLVAVRRISVLFSPLDRQGNWP